MSNTQDNLHLSMDDFKISDVIIDSESECERRQVVTIHWMAGISLNSIVTMVTGIANLCKWMYNTSMGIQDKTMTKQQYLTQCLMKHKLYGCR
jgi:hypothetical protein